MERTCRKCGKTKDINRFRKIVTCKLGRGHTCRECINLQEMNRLGKKPRIYRPIQSPEDKRRRDVESTAKWNSDYPEKYKAGQKVRNINRKKGHVYHHWSYNEAHWKDCIILSTTAHLFVHTKLLYDKGFKMYRRKDDGELLDTREKHEAFISYLLRYSTDDSVEKFLKCYPVSHEPPIIPRPNFLSVHTPSRN